MTINLTPETPKKQILVGGLIFSAPVPFAAGHVLDANEAAALNQTYHENLGNNFRSKIILAKKKKILGTESPTPDQLKGVTDEQLKTFDKNLAEDTTGTFFPVAPLEPDFEKLYSTYQMNVRRGSSVEVVDPVTKAARDIAKTKLKTALVAKGIKLNTVSAEWWTREVEKLLDKENPKVKGDKNLTEEIWKTAERQVNLLKQAANDTLDELDLDGMTKPVGADGEKTTASPKPAAKAGKKAPETQAQA